MQPREIFRYVREAFTPYHLPQRPSGKLNKTLQADYQRELQRAREIRQRFRERRFKILKGVGIVTGGAVLVTAAPGVVNLLSRIPAPGSEDGSEPFIEPTEYTGEVSQTRELIAKWQREVGSNVNKLESYTPRIANLAVAYFSTQMSEMFPDRADQYGRDRFTIKILKPTEYVREATHCGESPGPYEPGTIDPLTRRIAFSPRRLHLGLNNKNETVKNTFYGLIHELLHAGSPVVHNGEGFFTQAIKEPIIFKVGLKAFFKDVTRSTAQEECYKSWWYQAEEGVVDHATKKLTEPVGIFNAESKYNSWVNDYEDQVVKSRFGGRFQELLAYQQTTDLDGFLASIGRTLFPEAPFEAHVALGSNIAVQVFDENKLKR